MKNATQVQNIKIEIIQWLTKVTDEKTLEKILEIKESNNSFTISPEQEAELDKRLKKYLKGESDFKSWEDAKNQHKTKS